MGHPYGDRLLIRPVSRVKAGTGTQRTDPQKDTPTKINGLSDHESRRAPTPASPMPTTSINTLTVRPRNTLLTVKTTTASA